MSYCRWSCMDYMCDVYAYWACDGTFHIHVAKSRMTHNDDMPKVDMNTLLDEDPTAFSEAVMAQQAWLEDNQIARSKKIDLPESGNTFYEPTPEAAVRRLEKLRALGYNVPQYAIDGILDDKEEFYESKKQNY